LIDAGVVKPDENTVKKEEHVAEPEEYELTKDDFFELPDMVSIFSQSSSARIEKEAVKNFVFKTENTRQASNTSNFSDTVEKWRERTKKAAQDIRQKGQTVLTKHGMTIGFSLILLLAIGILAWVLSGEIKPSVSITEPPREQPTESEPYVTTLMKQGHLALEDSDWNKASDFFDKVLDINVVAAPAYTGLLCAELKVQKEELLGDHEKPISEYNNFQQAIRFANAEYRATLEGYDEKIPETLKARRKRASRRRARASRTI